MVLVCDRSGVLKVKKSDLLQQLNEAWKSRAGKKLLKLAGK
jgi:hypothetical protein